MCHDAAIMNRQGHSSCSAVEVCSVTLATRGILESKRAATLDEEWMYLGSNMTPDASSGDRQALRLRSFEPNVCRPLASKRLASSSRGLVFNSSASNFIARLYRALS